MMLMQGNAVPVTMSSREIADLTSVGHDNVLKTIRALAARGVVSGNETPYVHPQNGQTYTEYLHAAGAFGVLGFDADHQFHFELEGGN